LVKQPKLIIFGQLATSVNEEEWSFSFFWVCTPGHCAAERPFARRPRWLSAFPPQAFPPPFLPVGFRLPLSAQTSSCRCTKARTASIH